MLRRPIFYKEIVLCAHALGQHALLSLTIVSLITGYGIEFAVLDHSDWASDELPINRGTECNGHNSMKGGDEDGRSCSKRCYKR